VCLVTESAGQGDLNERGIAPEHHLARKLDPAPDQMSAWRLSEGPFECAGEVTLASLRNGAQIADPYSGTKASVDVFAHAPYLPVMQGFGAFIC
jgi:hypothetical protein